VGLQLDKLFEDPIFLMNVFETMRDGLIILDSNRCIQFFNRAAEKITGFSREEILGHPCTILDSDTCTELIEPGTPKSCDLFKKGSICDRRCRMRSKDGQPVYILKNAVTLKGKNDEIIGAVESITDVTTLYMKEVELEEIKREIQLDSWFMGLLGKSVPMQILYEQVRNAAMSEAPVLICGESGSGKDLVAHAIHKMSRRKDGPFIKMNCAALNHYLLESELFGHKKGAFTGAQSDRQGRFEAADGGTFFLDEIGDMPPAMQAKLLRVLEEKVVERVGDHHLIPVDIRLISATHKNIADLIPKDLFREDLFYRINSIFIQTPPLRKRKEDIPLLVAHYLKKISVVNNKKIQRMSPLAMELMINHLWQGNVRHLVNALEQSAITCKSDTIEIQDLPDYLFQKEGETGGGEKKGEREMIRAALVSHKGNKTLAAKHLGVSRVTLWKRCKEYGLEGVGKNRGYMIAGQIVFEDD
jgi:two-component system, NtrC family, response regulator HydG